MNKLFLLLFALTILISSQVRANQPPPEKTLAERVDLATNAIVGTAKSVRVLEYVGNEKGEGELKEVEPAPQVIAGFGQFIEVNIEVDETLYPIKAEPLKIVHYLFGGGFFEVESVATDTIGKPVIYLMSSIDSADAAKLKNTEKFFVPSYGWNLFYTLQQKDEIVSILQERVKREEAEKAKAKEQNVK